MRRIAVLLLPMLMTGCLAVNVPDVAETPENAATTVEASERLLYKEMKGHITVIVNYAYLPTDPVFWPITFPDNYAAALLEMKWDPRFPVNKELSLMLHDEGGSKHLGEKYGESPIRWEITSEEFAAGNYVVTVYRPIANDDVYVILDQDLEIRASVFDGPIPKDYSAW